MELANIIIPTEQIATLCQLHLTPLWICFFPSIAGLPAAFIVLAGRRAATQRIAIARIALPRHLVLVGDRIVVIGARRVAEIALQYRGRLTGRDRQYTFVLQHTQLDRVEGEGWITPDSVVQRYWALNDRQRRTGFETLYRLSSDRYHLSSGIMAGHYLTSAMEATLNRQ
jgi:hypothetical protein